MVVKKDVTMAKYSDEVPIRNLEVMMVMRSMASRGYCKVTFNWQYLYYYLTNEGINYLRQLLALPEDIVPATLKKLASAAGTKPAAVGDKGKSTGPGDFNPEFQKTAKDGYRT